VQRALVLVRHEVDGHALATEAATATDSGRKFGGKKSKRWRENLKVLLIFVMNVYVSRTIRPLLKAILEAKAIT
jgi:hypothetical protein